MQPARESNVTQQQPSGPAIVAALSLLVLGLHFATNGRYRYHGDELYFMACGETSRARSMIYRHYSRRACDAGIFKRCLAMSDGVKNGQPTSLQL